MFPRIPFSIGLWWLGLPTREICLRFEKRKITEAMLTLWRLMLVRVSCSSCTFLQSAGWICWRRRVAEFHSSLSSNVISSFTFPTCWVRCHCSSITRVAAGTSCTSSSVTRLVAWKMGEANVAQWETNVSSSLFHTVPVLSSLSISHLSFLPYCLPYDFTLSTRCRRNSRNKTVLPNSTVREGKVPKEIPYSTSFVVVLFPWLYQLIYHFNVRGKIIKLSQGNMGGIFVTSTEKHF